MLLNVYDLIVKCFFSFKVDFVAVLGKFSLVEKDRRRETEKDNVRQSETEKVRER